MYKVQETQDDGRAYDLVEGASSTVLKQVKGFFMENENSFPPQPRPRYTQVPSTRGGGHYFSTSDLQGDRSRRVTGKVEQVKGAVLMTQNDWLIPDQSEDAEGNPIASPLIEVISEVIDIDHPQLHTTGRIHLIGVHNRRQKKLAELNADDPEFKMDLWDQDRDLTRTEQENLFECEEHGDFVFPLDDLTESLRVGKIDPRSAEDIECMAKLVYFVLNIVSCTTSRRSPGDLAARIIRPLCQTLQGEQHSPERIW